jgi:hypothetical protein
MPCTSLTCSSWSLSMSFFIPWLHEGASWKFWPGNNLATYIRFCSYNGTYSFARIG